MATFLKIRMDSEIKDFDWCLNKCPERSASEEKVPLPALYSLRVLKAVQT